jgi:RNA polymerase sigma factor (sigma-70 family)
MFRTLVGFFRRNIRHAEAAPDLAQDALTAFHSVDVEKLENPNAYLMTIARRLAGKHRLQERRETKHLQSLSDLAALDAPIPTEELLQASEPLLLTPAVERAINTLDADSQDVLTLWQAGCTYEEIAVATDQTVDQVHRTLSEAKALLKSLLQDPRERN